MMMESSTTSLASSRCTLSHTSRTVQKRHSQQVSTSTPSTAFESKTCRQIREQRVRFPNAKPFVVSMRQRGGGGAGYVGTRSQASRRRTNTNKNASEYDLGPEIGKGGYASVHLVTHRKTGECYACKVVDMERLDAVNLERLEDEVKVLMSLQSCTRVARLKDVVCTKQFTYIIMELCHGGSIADAVFDLAPGTPQEYKEEMVAQFVREVLNTLAVCHSKGILHRDVKPENFLLEQTEAGSPVKAVDFGLSAFGVPWGECEGLKLQGTPWYIPPEALKGVFCCAGDVWGVGVMAHYLLTEKFPFDDRTRDSDPDACVRKIINSIQNDQLDMEDEDLQKCSKNARSFIQQLLERNPDDRCSAEDALRHPWLDRNTADLNRQLESSY